MLERNNYFDNLKGFLILCVIVGNSLEYTEPHAYNMHLFILILYLFHMPLFAFISGYFYKHSSRDNNRIVHKTLTLYLIFQIFYSILDRILYPDNKLNIQLFYPKWTLWYLLTLTFFYIIGPYIKNSKKWLIISIFISLLIGFDSSVGSHASLSRTFFFLPFFIAGGLYNTKYIEKYKKSLLVIIPLCIIILGITIHISDKISVETLFEYAYYEFFSENEFKQFCIRLFHYIAAFSFSALFLLIMPHTKKILSFFGKNSLIFYLAHSGVIIILYKYSIIKYTSLPNIIFSELFIILVLTIICSLYNSLKVIFINLIHKLIINHKKVSAN